MTYLLRLLYWRMKNRDLKMDIIRGRNSAVVSCNSSAIIKKNIHVQQAHFYKIFNDLDLFPT